MNNRFDIRISRKYLYIKCCYEHQAVTYLESSGVDIRPTFFDQFSNIHVLIERALMNGEVEYARDEAAFWSLLNELYGIRNIIGDAKEEEQSLTELYLSYRMPIFISCDAYYLPFSTQYGKSHQMTRIVLLDVSGSQMIVGDAQNFFYGELDRSQLDLAHQGFYNIPILPAEEKLPFSSQNKEKWLERFLKQLTVCDLGNAEWDLAVERIASNPELLKVENVKTINECLIAGISIYSKAQMFLEWACDGDAEELIHCAEALSKSWQRMQINYNRALKGNNLEELMLKLIEIRKLEQQFAQQAEERYLTFDRI